MHMCSILKIFLFGWFRLKNSKSTKDPLAKCNHFSILILWTEILFYYIRKKMKFNEVFCSLLFVVLLCDWSAPAAVQLLTGALKKIINQEWSFSPDNFIRLSAPLKPDQVCVSYHLIFRVNGIKTNQFVIIWMCYHLHQSYIARVRSKLRRGSLINHLVSGGARIPGPRSPAAVEAAAAGASLCWCRCIRLWLVRCISISLNTAEFLLCAFLFVCVCLKKGKK